jgi:putative ABC transport system permease protein
MDDERMEINSAFGIIVALLLIMVLLLALVGGLGLMGTMSLNVIERSREIGVIRAFGGSNRSVFRVVVLEGIVIGAISWVFSLLLALPLTWLFCDLIGHSFLSMALTFRYSAVGALLWLGLVVILAAVSSALPAANAVRLTVREVLSYE